MTRASRKQAGATPSKDRQKIRRLQDENTLLREREHQLKIDVDKAAAQYSLSRDRLREVDHDNSILCRVIDTYRDEFNALVQANDALRKTVRELTLSLDGARGREIENWKLRT